MKLIIFLCLYIFSYDAYCADNIEYINDFYKNEKLWNTFSFEESSYLIREGHPFGYTEYKIKQYKGKCSATFREVFMGKLISKGKSTCKGHTIAEQFQRTSHTISEGVLNLKAKYNESFGYMTTLNVEPITNVADSSWYIEVFQFKGTTSK